MFWPYSGFPVAQISFLGMNVIKDGLANHVLRLLHLFDTIYDGFGMSGR